MDKAFIRLKLESDFTVRVNTTTLPRALMAFCARRIEFPVCFRNVGSSWLICLYIATS